MAKRACAYICGGMPCRAPACLTFPVCRSHFRWWARHYPVAAVQRGARIAVVNRAKMTTVAFDHREVTATFFACQVSPRPKGATRGDPWVPIKPDDLAVIGDWLESQGKDASLIRDRFAVVPVGPDAQLSLL